jgi:hypothetical protein
VELRQQRLAQRRGRHVLLRVVDTSVNGLFWLGQKEKKSCRFDGPGVLGTAHPLAISPAMTESLYGTAQPPCSKPPRTSSSVAQAPASHRRVSVADDGDLSHRCPGALTTGTMSALILYTSALG